MALLNQVQHFNEPVEKQLGLAASIQAGKTLHLSGIISVDEMMAVVAPGDMAGQINRIYDIMEETLAKNQASLKHVVNEMIFVTDMAALAEVADIRVRRYAAYAPPATTAVEVAGLFIPGTMIEIQATAYLD